MGPYEDPYYSNQQPIDESHMHTVDLGVVEDGLWSLEKEGDGDKRVSLEEPSLVYDYAVEEVAESARSRFSTSTVRENTIRKASVLEKIRRKNKSWLGSMEAILFSSWVNILILIVPVLWALHFMNLINHRTSFVLSFLSLIPIIKLLDFGAESLALYCGRDIGDLILISLNNAVEAILALWLLAQWELRLLQSTIIGVTVLRLLLIPGVSFIVGGAQRAHQQLHPHVTGLNHSLLTMGCLAFLLPIAFFTALDRGVPVGSGGFDTNVISDYSRGEFLKISRGMAIILLAVYICSRFFLHVPPGGKEAFREDEPDELKELEERMEEEEAPINFTMSVILSAVAVTMMAITAEILVEAIEPMKEKFSYSDEWFGLILLPLVSFSADAVVSIVNFIRNACFGHDVSHTMASYRHVDDAIQFIMFWAPILVLLGWFLSRPMSLLFDLFEVAILIGACFLLNYVTEDSKTNWAEGSMLVALYIMVALAAWYYPQQPEIELMLSKSTISQALKDSNFGAASIASSSASPSATAHHHIKHLFTMTEVTTATATPTSTDVADSTATPTSTNRGKGSSTATSSSPTATATSLSEKLQELVDTYKVLVEDNEKLKKEIESELKSVMQSVESTDEKSSRERRSVRYVRDN